MVSTNHLNKIKAQVGLQQILRLTRSFLKSLKN